jgi:hypothetical protein
MQSLFLPFTDFAPDIKEHNQELFGHLHDGDIWRNYWKLTFID